VVIPESPTNGKNKTFLVFRRTFETELITGRDRLDQYGFAPDRVAMWAAGPNYSDRCSIRPSGLACRRASFFPNSHRLRRPAVQMFLDSKPLVSELRVNRETSFFTQFRLPRRT